MQITASLISIMMCGRDMIVSVAEITVSLVAMIGGVFSILISATEISISVMEVSISVRQVRNLLILGLHWPAGHKYLRDGNKYLRTGTDRRRFTNNRARNENECLGAGNASGGRINSHLPVGQCLV